MHMYGCTSVPICMEASIYFRVEHSPCGSIGNDFLCEIASFLSHCSKAFYSFQYERVIL